MDASKDHEGGFHDASVDRAIVDAAARDATDENRTVCSPNPIPTRCRGGIPQFCDSSAQWRDRFDGPCAGSVPLCLSGSCVAVPRAIGVSVGWRTSCARFTGGWLKCWGDNVAGQLGLGDVENRGDNPGELAAAAPIDLGSGRSALSMSVGSIHSCALLDHGQLKCWGGNAGALGIGEGRRYGADPGTMGERLPAVDLGTGRSCTALAAGVLRTCAVLDNGQLKCWGNVYEGGTFMRVIGDGPGEMGDMLLPVDVGTGHRVTAVGVGAGHTCAVLDDGQVKCWGANDEGQLGLGTVEGVHYLTDGNQLPAVNLGTGRSVMSIATRGYFTCALLDHGQVKCWGTNDAGELGLGDVNPRGGQPNQMGDNLPVVDLGTGRTAKAIDTGIVHACALLDNDEIKCWGSNVFGQLGIVTGNRGSRGKWPGDMGDNLPAVALGAGRHAVAVAAGWYHTCALLDDGAVKCWGGNMVGELGLGDTKQRGDQPGDMGDNLPVVPFW